MDDTFIPINKTDCMAWYMKGWAAEARLGEAKEAAEFYCNEQIKYFYGYPDREPEPVMVESTERPIEEHVELSETLDGFLRSVINE